MFTSRDCPLYPDCATTNRKENKTQHEHTTQFTNTEKISLFITLFRKQGVERVS